MAEKKQTILLDYKISPGLAKARQQLQGLVIDQSGIEKALLATNRQALTTEKAIAKVNTTLAEIARNRAVDTIAKNFITLEKETGDTQVALKELVADLTAIGASDSEIQRVTKSIVDMGNAAENASGKTKRGGGGFGPATTELRGLLGAAGGGGSLGVVTDILDLTDSLPKLKSAVSDLPGTILQSAQAIGPAGLVVAAGIGAVALAFNKMNQDLEPLRQNLDAALAANRKYAEFLASGATTEQVQARISQLEKAAAVEQEIIDSQTAALDAAFRDAQRSGDLLARVAFLITDADDKVGKSNEEARANLAAYQNELARLKAGLEAGELATNDAAAAEDALTKLRSESTEKIIQLEANRAALLGQFNEQQAQTDQDRAIRQARADEDLKSLLESQAAAHQDRLTAIADAGQQRIEAIREQGNERLASADQAIAKLQSSLIDANTKLAKDRAKIDSDYMASERQAYEKFRLEEAKADTAYNKARTRRLQDLNDDLLSAEESNDVVRFLQIQKAGRKDLQRMSEDASEAERQRQEAFEAERAQAERNRADRIADLEASAADRRADIQEQIQERKAAHDELVQSIQAQLVAEKKRIADTQKAEIAAFEAQQKREQDARDLRNRRQAEDERLADTRRRTALNKQLAEINTKINAEKNAAQLVGNAWTNMALQVGQVIRGLITNLTASTSSSSSSTGPAQSFATGGIVTRPTIARIGDRPGYHEALIPFRPSEGLDAALARHGLGGRSSAPNVYISNISVGDGVSESQLRSGLHELASVIIEGLDQSMKS